MGKQSNKRKAARQTAGLVNEFSQGGITVRATRAFPPGLIPLVVHAFRHFINDRTAEGIQFVAELQAHGYDFFDFTMASTTNPQLGNADPLTWAWGRASRSSLLWLTAEFLSRGRIDSRFFEILPLQLELAEEDSEWHRLGAEVFALFARYLVSIGVEPGFFDSFEDVALRACAIFNGVMAESKAEEERAALAECTPLSLSPTPSHSASTRRL